jgi:hypothetical protein
MKETSVTACVKQYKSKHPLSLKSAALVRSGKITLKNNIKTTNLMTGSSLRGYYERIRIPLIMTAQKRK